MTEEVPKRTDTKFSNNFRAVLNRFVNNRTLPLRTISVGVIESFNASKQTASVRPGIKTFSMSETIDNFVYESYEHPLLVNVPVLFPGGGDWHLTFPVSKGDECILMCADRDISIWKKFGGVRDPNDRERHHSIKDAIAMVGINPNSKALGNFNTSEPELRNRDGSTSITLGASGMTLKGNLTVEGTVDATGAISSDGEVTGLDVKTTVGTSLTTHTTSGVTPGAGVSGPPTPGT